MTAVRLNPVGTETPRIGIGSEKSLEVANKLGTFLADTYALYLQTLIHHWNVSGTHFFSLHVLFEEHYKNLQEAGDTIAERVRALGAEAPTSIKELLEPARLNFKGGVRSWQEMVRELFEANERCSREARAVLKNAEEAEDYVTVDLLTERMRWHEKSAWMLRSYLEN